jgi:hypothetical protein
MTESLKLEPRNLREVWDEIKPGLKEIKKAWPALSTWRVEDVYAAVLQEQAVIYMTDDGFAICTIETDKYSLKSDLYIWIAYSPEDKRGGILSKYLPSFIEVARDLGCSGVSTRSNHDALRNFPGMKPEYTKYKVRIDGTS